MAPSSSMGLDVSVASGGKAGHSDQHYPLPLPQAVWPSDIHIVSNGIPNYEYPPWILVVTWATDINMDTSCSKTIASVVAGGSHPGPGSHHVFIKSTFLHCVQTLGFAFSSFFSPCTLSPQHTFIYHSSACSEHLGVFLHSFMDLYCEPLIFFLIGMR